MIVYTVKAPPAQNIVQWHHGLINEGVFADIFQMPKPVVVGRGVTVHTIGM